MGERASNLFGVLLSLTFFSVLLAVMLVAVSILPDSSGLAPPTLPGETESRTVRTPQPVTLGSLALAPTLGLGPAAPVAPGSIPAAGTQVPGGEIVGPPAPEPGGPGNGTAPTGPSRAGGDDDEGRRDDEGEDGDGHEDDNGDDDDSDGTGSGKHSRDRSRDGRVGRDQGGTDHSEEGRGRGRGKDTGDDSDQGHGKGRGKEGKGGRGGSIGGNDRSNGGGHGSAGGHGHSRGKGKAKGKGH